MTERVLYIPFDHLNSSYGVMVTADKKKDLIVLVESKRMISSPKWHKERLFFLISSARHFAKELQDKGFQVKYLKAETTVLGLQDVSKDKPVYCAQPSSFKQTEQLADFGVNFVPNDFFLTPRDFFLD